ncbi:hypothetical protein COCON_G00038740 [Conger conger]|uniref:Signal-induced proliferation-associated 1-like protein C-terminal domain-containing protein n=1 Tax=Conger conger TaxID=82655 RepID=A0A9Q1E0S7_CONCO|nr:hypothetical protein COCON_G00038740 [Conger conger]
MQDLDSPQMAPCSKGDPSQHYRSSPSNQSSSSDPGPCGSSAWAQQAAYEGCQSPVLHERSGDGLGAHADAEGLREREPTLERTRSAEAKWHIPSTKILNALKERGLQKEGGKDSPNKLPRTGDKSCPSHCSSHSSSNTLSSNASSNSDDKHFGSGDLMDPEMLGLTYIKGASTDSGIDTAPCMPPPSLPGLGGPRVLLQGQGGQVLGWVGEHPDDDEDGPEEEQAKLYLPQGYVSSMAEDSMGDLSELSSHSSGSHHSGSPSARSSKLGTSLDSSKVYIVTQATPAPGNSPDARSCGRQLTGSQYLIGWKKSEDSPPPDEPGRMTECRHLYGPDAGVAVPMAGHDGSKLTHTLSKEEFLKMMLPDSPPGEEGRRKAVQVCGLSPRRSLYRTLSDESVCSNRRASSFGSSRSSVLEQALPNDILFSSTPPSTAPCPRMTLSQSAGGLRNEIWYSDGSLADKSKFGESGLLPLPDSGSGLDWSHLVDAARAFEGLDLDEEAETLDQRVASFCGMADVGQARALSQELQQRVAAAEQAALEAGEEGAPGSLTGKVNQLELILRQLQYDLCKEKQDKAMLQEQVQHLRQDNMRLHEESQTAAAQLRKFTEWFFHSIDKKP